MTMNPLTDLIICAEIYERDKREYGGKSLTMASSAADAAFAAIPDIKRIVEWVESADHKSGCDMWEHPHTGFCDCDLSEIQSLIRS